MEEINKYWDDDLNDLVDLAKRKIPEEQRLKFEGYAGEILTTLGMDLSSPSTCDTPRRFIQALIDATMGYDGDPKLLKIFHTECHGEPDCSSSQVIEGPIHFFSLCEHHVFPFYGEAYIGYVADEKIIGISKLTRLVRLFARRFAVQERIGQQVADTLEFNPGPARSSRIPAGTSPVRGDARGARTGADHTHFGVARLLCPGCIPQGRILYRLRHKIIM